MLPKLEGILVLDKRWNSPVDPFIFQKQWCLEAYLKHMKKMKMPASEVDPVVEQRRKEKLCYNPINMMKNLRGQWL